MAKLGTRILFFNPSPSEDVTHYRVRILPDGEEFSYDDGFAEVPADTPLVEGRIEVDLGSLDRAPTEGGTYDIFITAADAAGNESDPLIVDDAVIDFDPPQAPTAGGIE